MIVVVVLPVPLITLNSPVPLTLTGAYLWDRGARFRGGRFRAYHYHRWLARDAAKGGSRIPRPGERLGLRLSPGQGLEVGVGLRGRAKGGSRIPRTGERGRTHT